MDQSMKNKIYDIMDMADTPEKMLEVMRWIYERRDMISPDVVKIGMKLYLDMPGTSFEDLNF